MKTLKTLSKVTRQELDRRRRDLNVFLDKKDEILADKERLEKEFRQEQEFTSKNLEAKFTYTNYALNVTVKQENFDTFIEKLDEQIELMSEEISKGFSELKKYEILLERKEQMKKNEIDYKNRMEMDEIGTSAHERKKKTS